MFAALVSAMVRAVLALRDPVPVIRDGIVGWVQWYNGKVRFAPVISGGDGTITLDPEIPTFNTWQEKKAYAEKLVAEVKELHKGGIDDGEKSQEAHRKMAAAQTLMNQVKADRLTDENTKLQELIAEFEKGAGVAPGTTVIPGNKTVVPDTVPDDWTKMFGPQARLIVASRVGKSWFGDNANKLAPANVHPDVIKALGEGSGGAGGFLVPPAYLQNLFAETRRQGNALRRYGWLNMIPVETNQVLLPRGAGAATFAIVAENTTKPSADQSYTQVTINIFTWAGISKVSRQLVADSSPTVATLVNRELGTLAGNLEEQKVINGTGTGEPRGIMNTTGVNNVTAGTNTAQAIIDNILDGIVAVQTTYFAPPNGILMHPRRLAFLMKGKDTTNQYLFNPAGTFRAPVGVPLGVTAQSEGTEASLPMLLGLPVGVSVNVPTNLGGGTNQDAIIIANWNEAYWFERQDLTLDVSDQAGTAFESNQVWYRLEERAGFSAERYPSAFAVLTGAGLVP